MFRKYLGKIIASCIVILLPIAAGLILWNRLPEQMAVHWGISGAADGWGSRFFAVFSLPLIFLFSHLLCLFFVLRDPKNKKQNKKALNLMFWALPAVSLLTGVFLYASALGTPLYTLNLLPLFLGALFIAVGNYFPKLTQNRTFGIRVKWTLENAENWNATHRMGGRIWVAGGVLMLCCALLPGMISFCAQLLITLVVGGSSVLYSYLYHRRQIQNGTAEKKPPAPFTGKKAFSAVFPVLLLTFAAVLTFTGDISYRYDAESFTIHSAFWPDATIAYADIDSLEYRDSDTPGARTNGFGSARLLMGSFQNEEFDFYTRYSYTRCPACVVLTVDGRFYVLSGKDEAETKILYEALLSHCGFA